MIKITRALKDKLLFEFEGMSGEWIEHNNAVLLKGKPGIMHATEKEIKEIQKACSEYFAKTAKKPKKRKRNLDNIENPDDLLEPTEFEEPKKPIPGDPIAKIRAILDNQIDGLYETSEKRTLTAQEAQSLKTLTEQAFDLKRQEAAEAQKELNLQKDLDGLSREALKELIMFIESLKKAKAENFRPQLKELFRHVRDMDVRQMETALKAYKKVWRKTLEKVQV